MIKVSKIITEYELVEQNAEILEPQDMGRQYPLLFEDDTLIFRSGKDTYIVPSYRIVYIVLSTANNRIPKSSVDFSRVTLSYEIIFENVSLLSSDEWDRYGIPTIFKPSEQFAFMDKHGTYITSDKQIVCCKLK